MGEPTPDGSAPGSGPFAPLDRREAIRRIAVLMGGAVSASTVSALLAGCGERPDAGSGGYAFRTLDGAQERLVARLADLILPETDTPGALAAGAHAFIDTMLSDWMTPEEVSTFLAGVGGVDERARAAGGGGFLDLDEGDQVALLTELDAEAYAEPVAESTGAFDGDLPFARRLKELVLAGYYTSEIGATQELRWLAIPGRYDADLPLSEVGRSWA